jgi:hypothetical protein
MSGCISARWGSPGASRQRHNLNVEPTFRAGDSVDLLRDLRRVQAELRSEGWRYPEEAAEAIVRRWIALVAIVEDGYDGVGEEYDNDLASRDYIEELRQRLPGYWASYFERRAAPWDERFRAATDDSDSATSDALASQWWHRRLPRLWPGRDGA